MKDLKTQSVFVDYLNEELARRCSANENYSLRSFARNLDIDSSYLSKLTRGKRTISKKLAHKILEKLGFPKKLANLIPLNDLKSDFIPLDLQKFSQISEWYHFAILELVQMDNFVPSASYVASTLSIDPNVAEAAISRLKKIGLIEVEYTQKKEHWRIRNYTTVQNKYTHEAFRRLEKQILLQAIDALEDVPMEFRDQSSITMCTSPRRIAKAREKIKKFRRDLMKFLEKGDEKTAIFQLSVSLFPVTKITVSKKG